MTETKWTKGPWTFRTAANGDCGIKSDGTGIFVEVFADIRHQGGGAREEAEANAKLICAAPDLYAVVEAFEMFYPMGINNDLDEAFRAAMKALAKAQGKS